MLKNKIEKDLDLEKKNGLRFSNIVNEQEILRESMKWNSVNINKKMSDEISKPCGDEKDKFLRLNNSLQPSHNDSLEDVFDI